MKTIPKEIQQREIFLDMSYEDIINSCKSGIVDICNNSSFWLEKMNHEIDKYNSPVYNDYEFLREALELEQYEYFEAVLQDKSFDYDNNYIKHLLFQYGFVTNNLKIMKKYAVSDAHGLLKVSTDPQKIFNILANGYFTFKEYYNLISLLLKQGNISVLEQTRWILPVRLHPHRKIFDKLIFKYIGFSQYDKQHDKLIFSLLVNIYCKYVSSHYELFNLIHQNYYVDTIDIDVKVFIYPNSIPDEYVNDNLKIFKRSPLSVLENFHEELSTYVYHRDYKILRNMVYKNGKIIDYIITSSNKDGRTLSYIASLCLDIKQFRLLLATLNNEQFKTFSYYHLLWASRGVPDELKHFQYLRKTRILILDSRFLLIDINKIINAYNISGISNPNVSLFLAINLVKTHLEKHNLQVKLKLTYIKKDPSIELRHKSSSESLDF